MTFSTLDELIKRSTSGFSYRSNFQYFSQSSLTAYTGLDFFACLGSSTPSTFSGANLTWQACNSNTPGSIHNGGNVSPATKHIVNISIIPPTNSRGTFILVDVQGYWPGINVNSTSTQNLTGTPGSNLRYTNGIGCQLYVVCTGTATGATASNVSISYTNQAGTTGRSLGKTVGVSVSSQPGRIIHSGAATNTFNMFLPLTAGDRGVANVASITFSTATGAGTAALVLARPIADLSFFGPEGIDKDFISAFPSLPEVKDGACLNFLNRCAISSSFIASGHIDFAW